MPNDEDSHHRWPVLRILNGGLDMAARDVFGGELAWVSEIDKAACKLIEHRHPGVPNLGDITQVDWSQVEPVDILTGGSPCQDLSHAGRRAGMTEGTRSNLWVAMREAIAVLKPRLVIWENVRGANSAPADSEVEPCAGCVGDGSGVHLRALGRVLGDLASLGYDAQWHGLRAADIGFCHGRFRYFVAAYPQRCGLAGWASEPIGSALGRVAPAGSSEATRLLPSPRTSDTNGPGQHGEGGLDLRTAVSLLPTPMVGSSSPESHGQISGQYREQMADALSRWGEYADAIHRQELITGRTAPEPTQLSNKGNPQLSAAFSEWMMGLPAGHITDVPGLSRNEMLKLCGNGVIPQQAAYALRLMVARAAVMAA